MGSLFGILGAVISVYAIFNHQFWLFAFGSFLIGVFNGFATYFRFAAVDMVSVENRPKAISYVMVGGVIAAFVGPNLANLGTKYVSPMISLLEVLFMSQGYIFLFLLSLDLLIFHTPLPIIQAQQEDH